MVLPKADLIRNVFTSQFVPEQYHNIFLICLNNFQNFKIHIGGRWAAHFVAFLSMEEMYTLADLSGGGGTRDAPPSLFNLFHFHAVFAVFGKKSCQTRMHSRMRTASSIPYGWGASLCPGGLCPGGSVSRRPSPRGQTDVCEIITFPQTSFAGGNNFAPNSEVDAPPAGLSLALHKHVKMSVGKLLMETIHSHNVHIPEDQICF